MGIYLNPNNILFQEDMRGDIYVDKSMVINKLNNLIDTTDNYLCVSHPRRFGKTMMTNLISAYYSKGCDSRELFERLNIAQQPDWDKNLNKFNVIKFNLVGFFSDVKDKKKLPEYINKCINEELMASFPMAKIKKGDTLRVAILKTYATTGEQFVLIIDEYDLMVREKVTQAALTRYLEFLNGLFKSPEVREALHLAYLTGILPIVKGKSQSRLNEFEEYSITSPGELSEFIGFTEDEVKTLCQQHDMDFDECKHWYNGYKISPEDVMYNPYSIVEAMNRNAFDIYWPITGSYESITDYITLNLEGIHDDIISIIGGGHVKVNINLYLNTMTDFDIKDKVLTYLIHLGYLAYDDVNKDCWIPNNEIRSDWKNAISYLPEYSNVMNLLNESKLLLKHTLEGDEDFVAKALDKAHIIATNPKTYNNEDALQSAICLAYFYAYDFYTVVQVQPTGQGYADVIFVPVHPEEGRPALVIELKMDKTTETALTQIKNKQYSTALNNYTGNMLFVGINYDSETKKHQCKIERFVK